MHVVRCAGRTVRCVPTQKMEELDASAMEDCRGVRMNSTMSNGKTIFSNHRSPQKTGSVLITSIKVGRRVDRESGVQAGGVETPAWG